MKVKQLFEDNNDDFIFFQLDLRKKDSSTEKQKIFREMPDKNGYEKVYMPYGNKGKGFYYKKLKEIK
jgi:hypothetical protein